jgi:hypothetical protein
MSGTTLGRAGAACAVAGSALLSVGTWLHPQQADPNDALAAFTEYAANRPWVATHLVQLAGVALIVAALLVVAHRHEAGPGAAWARLGAGGAVASLAAAMALQAVDGVALKRMVDLWAAAPEVDRRAAFLAALAVRQVEVGLASVTSLGLGLTATVFGAVLRAGGVYPRWIGDLAIAGGVPTAVAGIVIAHTGFSGVAMAIDMPAASLLLVWMVVLGVAMWRAPVSREPAGPS